MKLLHYIIDGFHPFNETPLFTNIDEVVNLYPTHKVYDMQYYNDYHIVSRDAWCKIYSKLEPRQHEDTGFDIRDFGIRKKHNTLYSLVDPRRFIWSKLSEQGVTSYLFPFQVFSSVIHQNFLSMEESGRKNVNCDMIPYDKDKYYRIDNGDIKVMWNLPHQYSYFSEYFDKFKHTSNDYYKYIKYVWEHPELHSEEMPKWWKYMLENAVKPAVTHSYWNLEIFEKIVYPRLKEFSKLKDVYLHFALVEADGFYHFFDNFTEQRDELRENFFNVALKDVVEMCDADVVIITGDHGMEDKHRPRAIRTEFDVDGRHIKAVKSGSSEAILKMDHSHRQGAYILAKEGYEFFIEEVDKNLDLPENLTIGDAIYDTILQNMDK